MQKLPAMQQKMRISNKIIRYFICSISQKNWKCRLYCMLLLLTCSMLHDYIFMFYFYIISYIILRSTNFITHVMGIVLYGRISFGKCYVCLFCSLGHSLTSLFNMVYNKTKTVIITKERMNNFCYYTILSQ